MTRTLLRGLRVLEVLSRADTPLRMTDIARQVDLNLNTTGRLLATLEAEGFAVRLEDSRYTVGSKLILVAARKLNVLALSSLARPFLIELRTTTGETTLLVTRAGHELIVVDVVEGLHELRVAVSPGLVAPIFPAPTGWALVADESIEAIAGLQRRLGPARASESREEVQAILESLRRQGYVARHSLPGGEGTCTIAAPVRSHGVIVASVGVAGPARRWNEDTAAPHLSLLRDTVARIGAAISGADAREGGARLVDGAAG